MPAAVRAAAPARPTDGQNAARDESGPRHTAPAQPELVEVSGVSANALLIAFVFFFVLCVVAGVSTHDRFHDHTVPRSLK